MKLGTIYMNLLYLFFILFVALGAYRIGQDSKTMSEQTKTEKVQTISEEVQTISEEVQTISIDSLKKLGIDITLWMESQKDFELSHKVKIEECKTRVAIIFKHKEARIKSPYMWFEKKSEMLLVYWEKDPNLEHMLNNKDKKFVILGNWGLSWPSEEDNYFDGTLFQY